MSSSPPRPSSGGVARRPTIQWLGPAPDTEAIIDDYYVNGDRRVGAKNGGCSGDSVRSARSGASSVLTGRSYDGGSSPISMASDYARDAGASDSEGCNDMMCGFDPSPGRRRGPDPADDWRTRVASYDFDSAELEQTLLPSFDAVFGRGLHKRIYG